jgi:polar amino acid transport system substrate-binding protein
MDTFSYILTPPGSRRATRKTWLNAFFTTLILASALLLMHDVNAQAESFRGTAVSVCDDGDEWPPYSYWQRENGKKSDKVVGFSVDVLNTIFARHNIRYNVKLLPWARCLAELEQGISRQMALKLSYSEARDQNYLLTRPYYSTTNYYYFSRKAHPKGLSISNIADLKHYEVCGIHGYNYETYGLKPSEIDQRSKDTPALLTMLRLGRCDVFVEKQEILLGFSAIGEPYLDDPDLGRNPIPGMSPTAFHMAVSRAMPQALELRETLDREISQIEASGQMRALWKKAIAR